MPAHGKRPRSRHKSRALDSSRTNGRRGTARVVVCITSRSSACIAASSAAEASTSSASSTSSAALNAGGSTSTVGSAARRPRSMTLWEVAFAAAGCAGKRQAKAWRNSCSIFFDDAHVKRAHVNRAKKTKKGTQKDQHAPLWATSTGWRVVGFQVGFEKRKSGYLLAFARSRCL